MYLNIYILVSLYIGVFVNILPGPGAQAAVVTNCRLWRLRQEKCLEVIACNSSVPCLQQEKPRIVHVASDCLVSPGWKRLPSTHSGGLRQPYARSRKGGNSTADSMSRRLAVKTMEKPCLFRQ